MCEAIARRNIHVVHATACDAFGVPGDRRLPALLQNEKRALQWIYQDKIRQDKTGSGTNTDATSLQDAANARGAGFSVCGLSHRVVVAKQRVDNRVT